MPKIPKPASVLRSLARSALPQIVNLFIKASGNRIVTFNRLRSFYNLGSQGAARDLFNFAVEYSNQLSDIDRDTRTGLIQPLDVPLGENIPDPAALARRYRYQLAVQVGDEWWTIPVNSNDLLTFDELREAAQQVVLEYREVYQAIAEHLAKNPIEDIVVNIASVFRRY